MHQPQKPEPPHQLPVPITDDHTPVASSPVQPKGAKSLTVALVVSAVFLLASAGIGVWLLTKPADGQAPVIQQPTGDGSETVKKVTFVPPATVPAAYAYREQNTVSTSNGYYFDAATSCGITTSVLPLTAAESNPKDAITKTVQAQQTYGYTTTAVVESPAIKVKDTDGTHEYTFNSLLFGQDVSVQGVAFTKQQNMVAYKQFASVVAAIGYSCKTESWDTQKAQLAALVQTFNVKTER